MKQYILEPLGWPCRLAEAPCGLFLCEGGVLGFKSEYATTTAKGLEPDAFVVDSGEYFSPKGGRADAIVQPLRATWVEKDAE